MRRRVASSSSARFFIRYGRFSSGITVRSILTHRQDGATLPRHYCLMKGTMAMLQTTGAKASGASVKVVGPADGKSGSLGMIGVRFMIDGDETEGRFSLVEHPMAPRALA